MIDRELYYRILADYAMIRFSIFMEYQERQNAYGIFMGWTDEKNRIGLISLNKKIKL